MGTESRGPDVCVPVFPALQTARRGTTWCPVMDRGQVQTKKCPVDLKRKLIRCRLQHEIVCCRMSQSEKDKQNGEQSKSVRMGSLGLTAGYTGSCF